ncbi:MAG: endonuclease III, partial [Clostridia bacterium]|nr:endonuclease III [Clostridia bacterium]
MTQKQKKERLAQIVEALKEIYPEALCALEWGGEPWKLLIMGRLSAQCTDARVNLVCRELFAEFPTAGAMAEGDLARIEELVRPCGLFRTKAKSIKEMSEIIVSRFSGEIPSDMDELLALPGVGRKIA